MQHKMQKILIKFQYWQKIWWISQKRWDKSKLWTGYIYKQGKMHELYNESKDR